MNRIPYGYALALWIGLALSRVVLGGISDFLTIEEFTRLAADVAPKVSLFAEIWRRDPEAELYGGTSRDFLYWLKGRFRGAISRADVEARIAALRALPLIDVRDFISSKSDIDVLTDTPSKFTGMSVERLGLKKSTLSPKRGCARLRRRGRASAIRDTFPRKRFD